MRIGSVHIPSQLVLAPMAGVTDLAFRLICRELGAAYTITEMVSAKALCYQDKKTLPSWSWARRSTPAGCRSSARPGLHGGGAAIIREVAHPDIIDINMGLPHAESGEQRRRLRPLAGPGQGLPGGRGGDPRGPGHPVTVKMRRGWDKGTSSAWTWPRCWNPWGWPPSPSTAAPRCRCTPAPPIGTTSGRSSRPSPFPSSPTGTCSPARTPPASSATPGQTGVMIARGVFGNPWIFQQAQAALRGAAHPAPAPLAQRCDTAVRQFELSAAVKGGRRSPAWRPGGTTPGTSRGSPAGYWKSEISKITTLADVYRVTAGIKRELRDGRGDG